MNIETIELGKISQDPANVRKHSERNLEAIAASLRAFGQQKPIVIDSRGIILAGNGTYEAAKSLGWDTIQAVRTSLNGAQAAMYAIADNRTAELAEWDLPALSKQLNALKEDNDISLLHFDEVYLNFGIDSAETLEPETDQEATGASPGYDERRIRQIMLFYESDQFELIVEALADYAEKNGLADNSEAVAHLIEHNGYSVQPKL